MQTLLDQVDSYRVCDMQSDINKEYTSTFGVLYSDGEVHTSVTTDGYIKVTSITGNPNYLLYVDSDGDITLNIYKNTPRNKFDEIADKIIMMRNQTKIPPHGKAKLNSAYKTVPGTKQDPVHASTVAMATRPKVTQPKSNAEVIDVNTYVCAKCGTKPVYYDGGDGKLIAHCSLCKIDYVLAPSRYYTLESTRAFNKTQSKYTRDIKVKPILKDAQS